MSQHTTTELQKTNHLPLVPAPSLLLQRAAVQPEPPESVPPIVQEVLQTPGQPLDAATRAFMEPRFGHDFSQVRVHTDAPAPESAQAVQALAYTVGRDMVFGEGQYAPTTLTGQKLLAHELTHVGQQGFSTALAAPIAGRMIYNEQGDSLEREAEQSAERVMAGERASLPDTPQAAYSGQSAPSLIQRQALPNVPDVTLRYSPSMARLMGALTLDGFALNSAAMPGGRQAQLVGFAQTISSLLRGYPQGIVEVTGHTDATGGEAHNMELGQQRADTVRDALVAAGVPAEAILTRSAGEQRLLVPTQHAEAHNRRVDVRFMPELPARLGAGLHLQQPESTTRPNMNVPDLLHPIPLPPPTEEEEMQEQFRRMMRTPPTPRPRRSFNDMFWRLVDERLDRVMSDVGIHDRRIREQVRAGAHAAIDKGVDALMNAALEAAHVDSDAREAISNTVNGLRDVPIE